MKKILMIIGISIIGFFGLMVLYFFLVLRTKYKDVSKISPYAEIMNTTLATTKETLLFKYPSKHGDGEYPYHIEDGTTFGMEADLPTIVTLPIGTEITFEKAEFRKGGVSGETIAYMFGKVYSEEMQKEYAFRYSWGDKSHLDLKTDTPKWLFEKAFWQDEALEGDYYIKLP